MNLKTISSYARELRPLLSKDAFAPARSRLLWLPLHLLTITAATSAIAFGWVAWPVGLLLSLVIGASFAGLTFVGHEALHGALVRGKVPRRIIGWLGFMPFAVSPRLWEAWHNRVHHGNTNRAGADPDAYPTLKEYRQSRAVRWVTDWVSPGRSRLAGAFSLLFGFSVQSAHVLLTAEKSGILSSRERRLALLESGAAVLVWVALGIALGPVAFLLAFGLPLVVGNAIIMALILTNHSLSPHTDVNDPLINSLSVTGPRFIEWLTLGFGYHVEHHLFPAMSGRHGATVRALLERKWPERYQSLPYFRALLVLHRSPRVYQNPTTLLDPHSGRAIPTLGPATLLDTVDGELARMRRGNRRPSNARPVGERAAQWSSVPRPGAASP